MDGPAHPYLPQLVTLPEKTGFPEFTRPGQFAARLGLEYDPMYVQGAFERPMDFVLPQLTLAGDVDRERLQSRRQLLQAVDAMTRSVEQTAQAVHYSRQQQRAFAMLGSPQVKAAFDLSKEPLAVRDRYGKSLNAMSMLMARRLVEAGVPFVTVFTKEDPKTGELCKSGGSWDTHGSNFVCLRDHLLPEFDQYFSALLADLHDRGLLDDTLVLVNSEMGRTPKIGDPRSGGPGAPAGTTGRIACRSCSPAAASAAGRPTALRTR